MEPDGMGEKKIIWFRPSFLRAQSNILHERVKDAEEEIKTTTKEERGNLYALHDIEIISK